MGSREQWLEERRTGVGGSDAAAALGQSPHMTAQELYHIKLGTPLAPREGDGERTEFGRLMENVIAVQYAKRFDVRLRRRNSIIRHPRFPWMIANVDRLIEGRKRGVEIKNVDATAYRFNDEWGEPGSDQVPTPYLLQTAHYMAVLDYPEWDLAACIGGNCLEVYHIVRDPELEEMLIEGEREFWQHVEQREPPVLDYRHATAIPFLKRLYSGTNGETVSLPAEAEALHYARLDFDEQAKLMDKGAEAARARLMQMMGNASVGLLPNGGGYTRKLVERKAYEVEASKYIDFRFSPRKGA
ncbi:YqaJ viral recombinase family nuclease [Paraburkholderia tropica]|uniref:YqaJ viral recombinase family nuclease n=1 Tax=Paraburkholderia tropica TaxID=92647 RepID=UPI002AB7EFF6|nr:YqaJ viral recombinase family protein [Paraburkholderia tropica]